jgi:prevent-host-death family protein
MSDQISKFQFKAKALELFRRVETTGLPLVVTDNGKPKLEIRRLR